MGNLCNAKQKLEKIFTINSAKNICNDTQKEHLLTFPEVKDEGSFIKSSRIKKLSFICDLKYITSQNPKTSTTKGQMRSDSSVKTSTRAREYFGKTL